MRPPLVMYRMVISVALSVGATALALHGEKIAAAILIAALVWWIAQNPYTGNGEG